MINFLIKNYSLFLTIAIIFGFAFAGLIIENNRNKERKMKINSNTPETDLAALTSAKMKLGDILDKKDESDVLKDGQATLTNIIDEPK